MSDEETVAAVRANYEHGRGATFEETEVLFRALDAAEARAAKTEQALQGQINYTHELEERVVTARADIEAVLVEVTARADAAEARAAELERARREMNERFAGAIDKAEKRAAAVRAERDEAVARCSDATEAAAVAMQRELLANREVDAMRTRLAIAEKVVEAARVLEETTPTLDDRCYWCDGHIECAATCEMRAVRDALLDAHTKANP